PVITVPSLFSFRCVFLFDCFIYTQNFSYAPRLGEASLRRGWISSVVNLRKLSDTALPHGAFHDFQLFFDFFFRLFAVSAYLQICQIISAKREGPDRSLMICQVTFYHLSPVKRVE